MTTEQKGFIISAMNNINNMGKWNYISWEKFPVRMDIKDNMLITTVSGTEFKDELPMRGTRRDRDAMAKVVAGRICEAWGGTMEEVSEHAAAALAELYAVLGIQA